jgi:hypothetical protein
MRRASASRILLHFCHTIPRGKRHGKKYLYIGLCVEATVCHEDAACGETAIITGEKEDRLGDLIGLGVTAERYSPIDHFRPVLSDPTGKTFFDLSLKGIVDGPGGEDVYPDVSGSYFF